MAKKRATRKLGYAVIGIGHIVQHAVLPAFKNAEKNSRLVALVSGDREKREELQKLYNCEATYDYEQLDECLLRDDIDAVYIGLPNDMHAEYAIRCAKKGVHVLCEKPMDISSAKCREMIQACEENDVKLMIAYRLHFERSNLTAIEKVLSGEIGEPRYFSSIFSYQVKAENIRVNEERGGGPQWDLGPYCINAARYLFRAEPTEVFAYKASKDDPRFKETPEMLSVMMKFPDDRLAQFVCSFGSSAAAHFDLHGTKGSIRLENAYEYEAPRLMRWTIDDEEKKRRFAVTDQFGPELLYFSKCVLQGKEPEPDGYEGLADVLVIEAINRSAKEGRPVRVETFEKRARPVPEMEMKEPPVKEKELVHTEAPSQ